MTADELRRLAELAGLRVDDEDLEPVGSALDGHRALVESLDPDSLWELPAGETEATP